MNKFALTILGVAAAAALSSTAQAHDHCDRSGYGYRGSSARVYYAPAPVYYGYSSGGYCRSSSSYYRPSYTRSDYYYSRSRDYRSREEDCRSEHRRHHHGLRGFFERVFR